MHSLWNLPLRRLLTATALLILLLAGASPIMAAHAPATTPPAKFVGGWGDNYFGQLGDGYLQVQASPEQVRKLTGVTSVAAGSSHSLALKQDGTVWAWGGGNLGNGTTNGSATPVQVSDLSGVTAVAAGSSHSLA